MRYIVLQSNITSTEISQRINYIYDVFHIYVYKDTKISNNNMLVLNSIPKDDLDLLFIIGHNLRVDKYIKNNIENIREKHIVIISCCTKFFKNLNLLKEHCVFTPKNKYIINKHYGKQFRFGFDMTDEEILLYRYRKAELQEKLRSVFERIC